MKIKNRGIVLVITLLVILVLSVLSSVAITRSVSENWISKRYMDSTKAFWLAEAGVNKALRELKLNYDTTVIGPIQLGDGGYSITIETLPNNRKKVVSRGYLPFAGVLRAENLIESVMVKFTTTPSNFYDYAIYCAGNISLSGNAYDVNGDVIYAGTISSNTSHIDGDVTHDASVNPLARFNFDQLREISISQGNYHDANQLNGPFPSSFWYNEGAGIPNVVFLEGNLDLTGHTHVGGFFVVGGEVVYNATLSGNVSVDGAIYTLGGFTINGGGNALNINGGVWCGQATLNGSSSVTYNAAYMNAIRNLNLDTDVQIVYWKDLKNPYNVSE